MKRRHSVSMNGVNFVIFNGVLIRFSEVFFLFKCSVLW